MMEKACYSYSALRECADAVKATPWTVKRKAEHTYMAYSVLSKLFDLCYEKTGCCLFNGAWPGPLSDYQRLVKDNEAYRSHSKREMDAALKECGQYLKWEINGIRAMMETGEVNTRE